MTTKTDTELATDEEKLAIVVEERLQAEIATAKADLELAEEQRKARERELGDEANFTYVFDTGVDTRSARKLIRRLNAWGRVDPKEAITLIINSSGGHCSAGFAIIDTIYALQDQGNHITGVVRGRAQSMAAIILQACDERVIGPHSSLLVHEGGLTSFGTKAQVKDHLGFMELHNERMLDLLEARSTITRDDIASRWERRDWYIDANEALELGFVDRIG